MEVACFSLGLCGFSGRFGGNVDLICHQTENKVLSIYSLSFFSGLSALSRETPRRLGFVLLPDD